MTDFSIPVRVYIEDTDAGGIVYYVNYLKFMERSRTELLRTLGYDKPAILDDGLLLVVHAAQVEYQRSARLDDMLQVSTAITKLARTYVEFKQQVRRARGVDQGVDQNVDQPVHQELLCVGNIRVACVNSATMRPSAIPGHMHKQLTNFIESQSQG